MMKLLIAAGLAVSLVPAPASAAEFRLAITDVEGLERLQTEWGPFKAALEGASEHSFEFFPVASRTAAAESLKAERVDFVITGPAEYIVMNKLTSAVPLIGLSRPDYFCAIVVKADSDYVAVADLKGETVAMDDIGSTSGHLCPSQILADGGLNPQEDVRTTHTSRNIAHEALKRGDVAAIGVNYNSWISGARNADDSVPAGYFRVIARSGDLPNDVLMVGSHVDAALAAAVRDVIVENKDAIAEAIVSVGGENEKFRGMDLVAIEDGAYAPVRDMYATIGYPQFSGFVGE